MELKRIKVLIVDDQPLVLDILAKNLVKDSSIEICGTATDGYLALNQINRIKPDVIILDMEMPRMNGIQFLHNLMPVNPIPTIVLSALTEKDSKITYEAFEAGAVDFVPKPTGGALGLDKMLNQLWIKIKIAATQDVSHFKKAKLDYRLPKNALDRTLKTNQIILGLGDYDISNDTSKILKIFALGSCVGIALFCPTKTTAAMSHVVLPTSSTDPAKAIRQPGYFADTAVPTLLEKMANYGCLNSSIYAKIAGGAKTRVEIGDYFGIGQRNSLAVKANLLKNGIKILAEDIGGNISRTVSVKVGDKNINIYYHERGNWEI